MRQKNAIMCVAIMCGEAFDPMPRYQRCKRWSSCHGRLVTGPLIHWQTHWWFLPPYSAIQATATLK